MKNGWDKSRSSYIGHAPRRGERNGCASPAFIWGAFFAEKYTFMASLGWAWKGISWPQRLSSRNSLFYPMAAKKIFSPSRRSWVTVSCIQRTETGRVVIRATLPVTLICSAGKQPASAADIRA